MKLIGLLSLLSAFVLINSARFVLTKLTDLHEIEGQSDIDGQPLNFRHPTFQTMLGFFVEFTIFGMYAIPAVITNDKNRTTQHYMITFLYPALCDFVDAQALNMGMIQIHPSLATMIRTLMCPASALFAYFLLKARFSWGQIGAMVLIIKGVLLGCIVQLLYETEQGKFLVTFEGLVMLSLSACLQAFQAILEEQIFRLDPELNPLVLGGYEAFWKILLGSILIPFYQFIPCPTDLCEGGTIMNLTRALQLLEADKALCAFVIFTAIAGAGSQFLGYMVIKHENGVSKVTVSMLIIAFTWIFFLLYPGAGHENFNWIILISIIMLFAGSGWFVHADHAQQGLNLMDGRALNSKKNDSYEEEKSGISQKSDTLDDAEKQNGNPGADSEEEKLISDQLIDSPLKEVKVPVKKRKGKNNAHLELMSSGTDVGISMNDLSD